MEDYGREEGKIRYRRPRLQVGTRGRLRLCRRYIEKIKEGNKYYFLARPRRFGKSLYSNFKSSEEHIRLVFMTGISRFSKLSVFSDLNNLRDITFSDDYADVCGITEKELSDNMQEGINALAEAEVHTSDGRIDLLIETKKYIYVIELKYDGTPEEALRQIEEKEYARKFATDTRRIFRIGVSFSSKTRRIEGWIVKD